MPTVPIETPTTPEVDAAEGAGSPSLNYVNKTPKVLLVSTNGWPAPARLGMALSGAGFLVEAVCPPGTILCRTKAVGNAYTYRGLSPVKSVSEAIQKAQPDLVVPTDDLATTHLHEVHRAAEGWGRVGEKIGALIESSLGAKENFATAASRVALLRVAREEGIRVPEFESIEDANGLAEWIHHAGVPTVLKADGTSGGDGVRIVRTAHDAKRAFQALQAPPLFARAAKRAIFDRDLTLLLPSVRRRKHSVIAQSFVEGTEATSLFACWNGSVIGELHFEVVSKQDSGGPSTVLRLVEHEEMKAAARKIAKRLKLSGFYGLDFMLDKATRNAYLLELNPRTTQVGHLTLGPGRDLPAALFAAIRGSDCQPAAPLTEKDLIVLFPQEWTRDPESPFLDSGYHDVPWDAPDFVDFYAKQHGKRHDQAFRKKWIEPRARKQTPKQ